MSACPKHNSGCFDWEANQDTYHKLELQTIRNLNPNTNSKPDAFSEPNHKPQPHPDTK